MVDFLMRPDPVDRPRLVDQGDAPAVVASRARRDGRRYGRATWNADVAEGGARACRRTRTAQARQGPGTGPRRGHRPQRRPTAVRVAGGARPRRDDPPAAGRASPVSHGTDRTGHGDRTALDADDTPVATIRPIASGRSPASTISSTSPAAMPAAAAAPAASVEAGRAARPRRVRPRRRLLRRHARPGVSNRPERSGPAGRRRRRDGCRAVRRSTVAAARGPPRPRRRRCTTSGVAPLVVVTGGKQPGDRFTEAEASAQYLVDRGVPAEAIVMESTGRTTYQSMAGAAELLAGRGLDTVLVVTDPYHALAIAAHRRGRRADGVRVADAQRRSSAAATRSAATSPRPAASPSAGSSASTASDAGAAPTDGVLRDRSVTSTPIGCRDDRIFGRSDGEWCNWQHSRFWFCN